MFKNVYGKKLSELGIGIVVKSVLVLFVVIALIAGISYKVVEVVQYDYFPSTLVSDIYLQVLGMEFMLLLGGSLVVLEKDRKKVVPVELTFKEPENLDIDKDVFGEDK